MFGYEWRRHMGPWAPVNFYAFVIIKCGSYIKVYFIFISREYKRNIHLTGDLSRHNRITFSMSLASTTSLALVVVCCANFGMRYVAIGDVDLAGEACGLHIYILRE